MKPVYHKIMQCPRCGEYYDKGNRFRNDWHKYKMCQLIPENQDGQQNP